jgi:hypothetical protein
MPDRPEFTPPPVHLAWEEDAAFRHVFLYHFDAPDRAALRQVGVMLHRYVLETAPAYGPDLGGDPPIRAELRAAVADLRVLWGFFTMLQVEGEDTHQGTSGARLTDFAGTLAEDVERLALRIEGELS